MHAVIDAASPDSGRGLLNTHSNGGQGGARGGSIAGGLQGPMRVVGGDMVLRGGTGPYGGNGEILGEMSRGGTVL